MLYGIPAKYANIRIIAYFPFVCVVYPQAFKSYKPLPTSFILLSSPQVSIWSHSIGADPAFKKRGCWNYQLYNSTWNLLLGGFWGMPPPPKKIFGYHTFLDNFWYCFGATMDTMQPDRTLVVWVMHRPSRETIACTWTWDVAVISLIFSNDAASGAVVEACSTK